MQLWQTQRYQSPKIICCGTLEKPQFAYEAHMVCDSKGFLLDVEVTAGNVRDRVAWDKLYNSVTGKHEVQLVTMAAGYKTPWIAKKNLDDGKLPISHGGTLRHTTTDRDGKITYRSTQKHCRDCPYKDKRGANEKWQKVHTTHIWQEYLDLVEQIRKTQRGEDIYAERKKTIERVFADAKEKHAMRCSTEA